ncbi:unnamed protein product [Orchesella dallaii]|uniref:Gustatory receptor n=1 Tax=Orchesella dallaii TaxID=48710 RepID=A0ABP1QS52_9HEXA
MAFSEGAVNVNRLIQKLFITPYYISINKNQPISVIATYKPFEHSNFSKLIWNGAKLTMILILGICFFRLQWLLSNWKHNQDMRQLGVYITAPCLVTIALAAYHTLEMFKEDWCYMMTQRFILSELDHDVLRRHSVIKIKIGEALMYLMFLGFLTFPIVMASVTLLRDNDPVQLILRGLLRTFLPSWLIKLITSLIYAGIVSHGAATILTIILISVALVDAARKLSAQLSYLPRRQNTGRGNIILRREFKNRLKLYRELQILFNIANNIAKYFLATLVGIGIYLTAALAFFVIFGYNRIPIYVTVGCCVLVCTNLSMSFLLFKLATFSYTNGVNFKIVWLRIVGSKSGRKDLKSCPHLTFSLLFVKTISTATALEVADAISNVTASLVLLSA